MNEKHSFSLKEISAWGHGSVVKLPDVQRNFVWKPSQIENLWDSILRGFPVGAFVFSKKTGDTPLELLDGQQRATAICLGFGHKTFRGSESRFRVFLDLVPPDTEDRKFMIRVITQSHPWGYQRKDNTKTLESENVRKAMAIYEVDNHLDSEIEKFFPYDAKLPIPLDWMLEADDCQSLLARITKWPLWDKIKARWSDECTKEGLDHCITTKIDEYASSALEAAKQALNLRIPALYLDLNKILDANVSAASVTQDSANDDDEIETPEEVESLFVRLNSGGTPLRGEELNYSILKAHIDRSSQEQIESACAGFLAPSRFISIAFRLFQMKIGSGGRDSVRLRIKTKQFQNLITSEKIKIPFVAYINELVASKVFDGFTLLEYAKKVLLFNKETLDFGLPYPVVVGMANKAPEIMLVLFYRLSIMNDRFDSPSSPVHRRMIGLLTLFYWYGKSERKRDYSRLIANIWPCVQALGRDVFWSSHSVQRAMLDDVLPAMPAPDEFEEVFPKGRKLKHNTSLFDKSKTQFRIAIESTMSNRDIILYSQREFISDEFEERHFNQDDTNTPFDWDHISPHRFVKNKKNIPRPIRDIYNSIGNFRAWPFSLNRIDQDAVPSIKLNPLSLDNEDIKQRWIKYYDRSGRNFSNRTISKDLMNWSFCEAKEWLDCEFDSLSIKEDQWRPVFSLISGRASDLYRNWYKNLCMSDLVVDFKPVDVSRILNKTQWKKKHNFFRGSYSEEGLCIWGSNSKIQDTNIELYLAIPENPEEHPLETIREGNISFGLFDFSGDGLISKLKIPEDKATRFSYSKDYVEGTFTLFSTHEDSLRKLAIDIQAWIDEFPDDNLKKLLADKSKTIFKPTFIK